LPPFLERAQREGAVRVKRRDGRVFLIQPERSRRSPLDVAGIDSDLSAKEIVGIVREMRQRVNVGQLMNGPRQTNGRRRTKSKKR
jgi:hypothetical protein